MTLFSRFVVIALGLLCGSLCSLRAQAGPTEDLNRADIKALQRGIQDLTTTFGDRYPHGPQWLRSAESLAQEVAAAEAALKAGDKEQATKVAEIVAKIDTLRREALLANPLLDFEKLLLVRRQEGRMGLPQNWQGNCSVAAHGYDNQISILSPVRPGSKVTPLYTPEKNAFVGDVDLHFNADKMLLSMPKANGRWHIYEMKVDGSGLRQVSADEPADVDNFDACYLPDGRIAFCSTRCFQGVPCVGGGDKVSNLFIMDADGKNVRQLCFDQDHDWCPTVMHNGRILYTRWEYSDTPHYFTRLLFTMNPDGTNQAAYYGSNSYWPNSMFFARPIPNHPTKVVAIVSGHHGVQRMGELVVFDPALGRTEDQGAVQRIPGFGRKVEPVIKDELVANSWPKFLHPYPLSDKHFLVSCKLTPQAPWSIYLVDTFDNFVLLAEEPGYALLEPVPLKKTPTPPVIPDRINPKSDSAVVHSADIYAGEGMQGVPRGTVKKLRVLEPHFAYPGMGGHLNIGIDGPWDGRRIWGTVKVDEDGSVSFKAPANTPLALQPLDKDGKCVAVMRSWFTAMPGETVSCVGCHESQNRAPLHRSSQAVYRTPSAIDPWYGPARGFSFKREVQPVLDKHCVGCHDGKTNPLDLRVAGSASFRKFTPSYVALHPFVRRPGPESDYHLQWPMEWHAGTSELVQLLEKGHYNVKLDPESWDRLITWIDLNVPDHGSWQEERGASPQIKRRLEMRTAFAARPEDPEAVIPTKFLGAEVTPGSVAYTAPAPVAPRNMPVPEVAVWPFDATEAANRQKATGLPPTLKLPLNDKQVIELVLIPAGEFVIGAADGANDEFPQAKVKITRPFYMSRTEITNAQFQAFRPAHDSAYISMTAKDQTHRGHPVNRPDQPVVRVAWTDAVEFCRWAGQQAKRNVNLPTEAQWEWAARGGTGTATYFGAVGADFGKFANLADASLIHLASGDSPKWHPRINSSNDGALVTQSIGRYQPNAWGLCDMIGNAAEWTRTTYRPYPYDVGDGRDDPNIAGTKVVRGGSWYDRPYRATASYRLHYQPWQHVFNVGFRIIVETDEKIAQQ